MSSTFIIDTPGQKEAAIRAVLQIAPADRKKGALEVVVKKHDNTTSAAQTRLYWRWLTLIGSETGNDKYTLHDHFRTLFLPPVIVEMGGEITEARHSTQTLTVKQMQEYMDRISALAGEMGISLEPLDAAQDRRAA